MFRKTQKLVMALVLTALVVSTLMAQDSGPVAFSLRSVNGNTVTSDSLRGEVVVLADTDFADERFAVGAQVHASRSGVMTTLTVRESREHDGRCQPDCS